MPESKTSPQQNSWEQKQWLWEKQTVNSKKKTLRMFHALLLPLQFQTYEKHNWKDSAAQKIRQYSPQSNKKH